MKKISGIYCIKNLINNKMYIGKSNNIYKRWQDEKSCLQNDTFHNRHFQRAWHKYGENSFEFFIIEECSEDELSSREIAWIKYFDTYYNGYNQTLGGEGSSGAICSEEKRHKLSESHIGKKNKHSRPVYCVELDETFWGAKDAQDKYYHLYGVCKSTVSLCCNRKASYSGKLPNGHPLHWCFIDDIESFKLPITPKCVPIYCYELKEYFPSFSYVQYDIRIVNAYHSNLKKCCDGNLNYSTCGSLLDGTPLTWRYVTNEEIEQNFFVI